MARFENKTNGVVVSVDDSKADRFGPEWKPLGEGEAPGTKTRKTRSSPSAKAKTPADDESTKSTTVKAIIADVGSDPVKAAEALAAEQSAEEPRSSLIEKLEAVIAAGDGTAED